LDSVMRGLQIPYNTVVYLYSADVILKRGHKVDTDASQCGVNTINLRGQIVRCFQVMPCIIAAKHDT
jgi:hypothetical protein